MKIYLTHPTNFDFKKDLYQPLRQSELNANYEIVLPHEDGAAQFNSKEQMSDFDLVVAEVSFPSTGQGIELGWADMAGVPIICMYKKGQKYSYALKTISEMFIEYTDSEDFIRKLTEQIEG